MRIATLLPSATEIVCALGAADELVGISHACDFPAAVLDKPRLTRCFTRDIGQSAALDEHLRSLVEQSLSIFSVDSEALEAVAPDLIITQSLCDVCAVSFSEVHAAAQALGRPDLALIDLRPNRLQEVWDDIAKVGAAIGRDPGPLLAEIADRTAAVAARVAGARRPTVLSIEWLAPAMVGGGWMPELIAAAGGIPLVTEAGDHAPTLSDAGLAMLDPDVVLIKPCGFTIPRTLEERGRVELLAGLFPRARVYVADGDAYFNRSGPRLIDSLEILAAALHPDRFPPEPRLVPILV